MTDPLARLRTEQRELLQRWFPDVRGIVDHSWGLVDTSVIEAATSTGRIIVKGGTVADHHIARELRAHERWTQVWADTGDAPALLRGSLTASLLATTYMPGRLVQGTDDERSEDVYRQAGALLARFHGQHAQVDRTWGATARSRTLRFLDLEHRIAPGIAAAARAEVSAWVDVEAVVVPTHGDWQPRNWLVDNGAVRVIDFGRAGLRPRVDDLTRVTRQPFVEDPRLESAFFEGYGDDPRHGDLWRMAYVGEAVATAVWAYMVGDETFEALGLRQLATLYGDRSE